MRSNKKSTKVFEYIVIVLMGILSALNYIIFIINNRFAPSGINGIATMIEYKLNFSIGYFALIVNIPLVILAFLIVDREFSIKSGLFTLSYSISYILLRKIDFSAFDYNAGGTDVILPVLAASIISGFIGGVVFKINSSTGGTDIVGKIISKKYSEFNFIWVTFILNVLVASVSYFVYGQEDPLTGKIEYDLKPVILCIIYCFVSSLVGNRMLNSAKAAVKFDVITDYGDEITKEILSEIHHGVTISKVEGGYSHKEKTHLICVVNKHQIVDFERILSKYSNTFAYFSSVNGTVGNFQKVRHKRVPENKK